MRLLIFVAAMNIVLIFSSLSFASSLSEPELFYRCYAHITGKRVKSNNAELKKVLAGTFSAAQACQQVLSRALLQSNGRLRNTNSHEARNVLRTFNKLHMDFFVKKDLNSISSMFLRVENDIFDQQSPALFFTKALFDKNFKLEQILSSKFDLEGVRSNGRASTRGPSSNILRSRFVYSKDKIAWPVTFVQTGDLVGVQAARQLNVPNVPAGRRNILAPLTGGGVLASRVYIKKNIASNNPKYDGANKMNRTWSQNVLADFLCKSLPAVRISDAQPYKHKDATADFRKSDSCVRCHATMDQLAAGARGFRLGINTNGSAAVNPRLQYSVSRPTDSDSSVHWPIKADPNYSKKIPRGVLYFRSYDGTLVHERFKNMQELGSAVSKTKDFYACVAKKYYKHFTGISVSLADINDPMSNIILNEEDLFHRNEVIALGEKLKNHQSPFELITDILNSPIYRQEGYTHITKEGF